MEKYLITCLLFLINIAPILTEDSTDALKCLQGSVWNGTACVQCPSGTYWRMIIVNETEVSGARCEGCPQWFHSPPGAKDFTMCVCDSERCKMEPPKSHNLPVIVTIIGVIVGFILVVVGLVYCKMYSVEFMRMFRNKGRHTELSQTDDDSLLHSSPSPPLPDVQLNVADEDVDDAYNDITAKGDINDIDAVVRAAVISEKRRSRCYSMSSMTDLSVGGRYRTVSMNSASNSNYGNYGNYGIEKAEIAEREVRLPLPAYDALMAQTNRTTQF